MIKRKRQDGKAVHKIRKRITVFILICCMVFAGTGGSTVMVVRAESEEPDNLYAQSAVLMDADSGRILFSKNGQQEKAMASTTKIMTCILALEYGKLDSEMTVSSYAASQPKVHLGAYNGEIFYLRDLLYSLMLESHNDAAVIIAENIGGSVEGFADMMNAKAKELGCGNTYFITPNGLDAADENGSHHTTAEDLARIMKYCIMDSPQKEMFLEITRTPSYQFTDCSGKSTYSCTNHNAFLQMMDGALSGKTGFTGDAGYCYVGALRRDDRTFIVALLACGWPNNKSYKWADTKALMNYALDNYEYRDIWQEIDAGTVRVKNGIDKEHPFQTETEVPLEVVGADPKWRLLLKTDEQVEMSWEKEEILDAPVVKGQKAGKVVYTLNGEELRSYDITTVSGVQEKNFKWYIKTVFGMYMLKNINLND
ncbi:D-alanyl-D-alanine carboxypeptidase family protein [Faecalicatena contorta]|uniref:D-alanyl-D-alanine carboxypeptidase family protein n=1 Tax=Faecalicatena contorta TaxID=39482 RepID=UPI0031D0E98C